MNVTPIHKELIQIEINQLNKNEVQEYLREAIAKVSYFYSVIEDKPLTIENKAFLKAYWRIKLNILLDTYFERYGQNLSFLTASELKVIRMNNKKNNHNK